MEGAVLTRTSSCLEFLHQTSLAFWDFSPFLTKTSYCFLFKAFRVGG
jgi:hypothetical protein